MFQPNITSVKAAIRLIAPFIHKTPVYSSEFLNNDLGCSIFFKCENFQKSGAFKFRGATNAILNLDKDKMKNGVATHSSGNHAGALAKAAKMHGIKAYIVMPKNAPQVKIDAVQNYGGIITFCEPTLEARESTLDEICKTTGAIFIHPYDNFYVISGQGTACLEFAEQIEAPDFVITPVGGGGLLSGTSIAAKYCWQNTKVIGAEPKNADDAFHSFYEGKLMPSVNPSTIADGLLTSLSELTFSLIQDNVDDILTVKEESIVKALKLVFQYLKIIIEPSSAVVIASIIENRSKFAGKKVGVIISGGNYQVHFDSAQ